MVCTYVGGKGGEREGGGRRVERRERSGGGRNVNKNDIDCLSKL